VNHEYNSKTKGLFPKSAIGLGPWVDLENSRVFFAKPWDFLNYLELFLYWKMHEPDSCTHGPQEQWPVHKGYGLGLYSFVGDLIQAPGFGFNVYGQRGTRNACHRRHGRTLQWRVTGELPGLGSGGWALTVWGLGGERSDGESFCWDGEAREGRWRDRSDG
jgi:hypothetical protein